MCMHIYIYVYVCMYICLYTIYMSEPHIHTFFAVWSFAHITFATSVMGKMPIMRVKDPFHHHTDNVLWIFIIYLLCVVE